MSESDSPQATLSAPSLPWLPTALVVAASVILPRLAALGSFPELDAGYHAFMAQYIWNGVAGGGAFPPDMTGFRLFPAMLAWVWSLPGNAMLWLRAADLCAAALAAWLLCDLLVKESGNVKFGLWLALAALLGMNAPGAIDSGFKNSFMPAFACLFLAVILTRSAAPTSRRWLLAGFLAVTGSLFRETFFYFPLLACVSLLFSGNPRALWRFFLGGVLAAVCVTLVSALLRGQFWEIFEFYRVYGRIYEPEAARRLPKFFTNGLQALCRYWPMLLLGVLAFVSFSNHRNPQRATFLPGRALFWLAAAFLPLIEPFSKIGFLYHFSVCLPGVAGFCALAYSRLPQGEERKTGIRAAALAALCMAPLSLPHFAKAPLAWEVLKHYPEPGWPARLASHSTTLEAAKKIRKALPANGKVSSSGFAYFIFPATQTLPPEMGLGDLSRTYIFSDYNKEKFLEKFNQNPPDLALVARAASDHSATFEDELRAILDSHPDYELVDSIHPDRSKNYGWLGYWIYRRIPKTPPKK